MGRSKLRVYPRGGSLKGLIGKRTYAWQLQADNGEIIGTDGGQGYMSRAKALEMGKRIISGEFADAIIEVVNPK